MKNILLAPARMAEDIQYIFCDKDSIAPAKTQLSRMPSEKQGVKVMDIKALEEASQHYKRMLPVHLDSLEQVIFSGKLSLGKAGRSRRSKRLAARPRII